MPDEPATLERDEAAEGNGHAPTTLTSKKSSTEFPMREGEAELVEWVESLYVEAESGKRDQCDPDAWPADVRTYWGDQWSGAIPSYKPRIVVNEIKSLVLQELSDLTDSRQVIYVQKDKKSGPERDKDVENAIQSYWTRRFCDLTVMLASLDAMIHPLGFIQCGWDPYADQGQGDVTFKHRDPVTVFPDPDAVDDDELRYMVLEDVKDLVEIRRLWPETGMLVEPDGAYSTKIDEKSRPSPRAGSQYTGPLYSGSKMVGVPGYQKARARILTCIVDDDQLELEMHELGGKLVQMPMPKYPHKRLIQVANRRVLGEGDMPYHYAPIIQRVALQPSVHGYWPEVSTVGEFAEIQSTANKMDSLVAENALRLNMGEVYADADSGINPKTYGGIPGAVYLIKPGSKVQKTYPTAMPADMVGGGERFRGYIRGTMGYPLPRQGAGPHGNVAAELAETEISQSMGLTRLRGRLMHQAVQRSVQMIFARMAQFYTTPRHLPYIDQGELKSVKWVPLATPESYLAHVDPASFEVRSKTMMQRLFMALAKMNKMPTGRLLKSLGIPDAEAITAELTQELILMAAARGKGKGGGKR